MSVLLNNSSFKLFDFRAMGEENGEIECKLALAPF